MPEQERGVPNAPSAPNDDADENREHEQRAGEGPQPGSETVAGGTNPRLYP